MAGAAGQGRDSRLGRERERSAGIAEKHKTSDGKTG